MTVVGEKLYPRAERIVGEAKLFQTVARSSSASEVVGVEIACSPSVVNELAPLMLQQSETALDHIRLNVHEAETGDVEMLLADGIAEIGICHVPRPPQGFTKISLRYDDLYLVGAPEIVEVVNDPSDLSGLSHIPLMSWPREQHPEYFEVLMNCCLRRGLDPLTVTGAARLTGSMRYLLN